MSELSEKSKENVGLELEKSICEVNEGSEAACWWTQDREGKLRERLCEEINNKLISTINYSTVFIILLLSPTLHQTLH